MKNILFITPYFPPNEAVGSKRSLNLARHLGKSGWQPVILTNPDNSRKNDDFYNQILPENRIIVEKYSPGVRNAVTTGKQNGNFFTRIPLLKTIHDRGHYFTPFDQYMWHIPYAIRSAKKLVEKYRPVLILVNADPWSTFMVAHRVSRWANIPWIADMRDPWSLHEYKMNQRPSVIQSIIRYYEGLFFRSAAKIILNTENCCHAYQARYSTAIDVDRFTWIRNAFDREIYKTPRPGNPGNRFSLHYFGSFRDYVRPDRLFDTVSDFIRKNNISNAEFELVLYGNPDESNLNLARHLDLLSYITIHPYIKSRDTLQYLQDASLLVLIEGPERNLQLPAKLYDYLASGRPIWAISDNEELNRIIRETCSGVVSDYHDSADCLTALEQLYASRNSKRDFNEPALYEYSVQRQITKFCDVFSEVCSSC